MGYVAVKNGMSMRTDLRYAIIDTFNTRNHHCGSTSLGIEDKIELLVSTMANLIDTLTNKKILEPEETQAIVDGLYNWTIEFQPDPKDDTL